MKYKIKFSKKIVISLVVIFLAVIAYGFSTYYFLKQTYFLSLEGKSALELVETNLVDKDFKKAQEHLIVANQHFKKARLNISTAIFWKLVPWVNTQIITAEKLLKTGINLTSSLEKATSLVNEINEELINKKDFSYSTLTKDDKKIILEKIYNSKKLLTEINKEANLAIDLINNLPYEKLYKPLKEKLLPIKNQLPKITNTSKQLLPLLENICLILGYPEDQTYLLLLQNHNELRPTGGFIGTYGIVKIDTGELSKFKIDNIYNLDGPADKFMEVPAPKPLQKYNKTNNWHLRDSNWIPDFPTSATQAEWFYHEERGEEKTINGVIAITPVLIEKIMDLIGPITLNGITFDSNNLVDKLENRVGKEFETLGISLEKRKDIIKDLADEIKTKIFSLPVEDWEILFKTTLELLKQKDILIHLKDENLAKIIRNNNWDGKIINNDYDYIMVVDANLGSLKTDQVMSKEISYSIKENENNELIANLQVKYINNGAFTWKTTRYRTYTRIYVPLGSKLISVTGLLENDRTTKEGEIEIYDELNKTVFAGFISIEPKQTGVLTYTYKLPDNINTGVKENIYKLYVQKQPGNNNIKLNVSIKTNNIIKEYSPKDLWIGLDNNKQITISTDLNYDREFFLLF